MTDKWTKGYEGCDTPGDLGWKHGTEDAGDSLARPRPGCRMTPAEFSEYKDQYYDAKRGWD